jgi:hypothetical protein
MERPLMLGRFLVGSSLILATCIMTWSEKTHPSRAVGTAFLYTVTSRYEPLAWMRGGDRFPLGGKIFKWTPGGARLPLVKQFTASADPTESFDGERVLFAGKESARDHWQIWEISLTSGDTRRVTYCRDDCIRPFYLPEDRIVYSRKTDGRFLIEVAPLGGGSPLRLSYAPGNFLPTDVLRDGRVLFEASYPLGNATAPELYTVYTDGSGVESYRCDHGHSRHSGKQLASADIVFVRERGLGRFTSALAHELEVEAPRGEYADDIAEDASGEWLFSRRPDAREKFRLEGWNPGSKTTHIVVEEKNADVVQPVLLVSRHIPNRHPSGLHDWNYANLLCLNAYTSKYPFTSASISSARLYTQDQAGAEKLLGSSAVEKDGSFYLRVPADQPLRIELRDSSGRTLKKEQGWFWMRRGEQRICVGCHAGPETAPENASPMVLRRSIIPADMTENSARATVGGK